MKENKPLDYISTLIHYFIFQSLFISFIYLLEWFGLVYIGYLHYMDNILFSIPYISYRISK